MGDKIITLTAITVTFFMMTISNLFAQNSPLIGVWEFQGDTPVGNYRSELVIKPDGQFSKLDSTATYATRISGSIALLNNPPTLRLNITDYDPKETCGPLGCNPIQMVAAEVYSFKIGGNTLALYDSRGQEYVYLRKAVGF